MKALKVNPALVCLEYAYLFLEFRYACLAVYASRYAGMLVQGWWWGWGACLLSIKRGTYGGLCPRGGYDPLALYVDTYLRTQSWRNGTEKKQPLLNCIRPHKEVVKSTLADWVKEVLKNSGIDISQFKTNSTRSVASSKVGMSGLSVKDIFKRENWSNKSTWQRFYIEDSKKFEETLLEIL